MSVSQNLDRITFNHKEAWQSEKAGCIKKIPLNPPLQKGEAVELPELIEMLQLF